ncbi:MAG: hypothetical protein Q9228_003161 [Teloschistes exilis]
MLKRRLSSNSFTEAIAANVKLCATANVTVPNYLGCSPSLASKFTASMATAAQTNSAYIGIIQSEISVPTGGPVATFNGGALFTGTCTSPIYAVATMLGGGVLDVTGLRKRASVGVVVTTQVYTLKYALKPKKSGLSVGVKVAIAVGGGVAFLLGVLLCAFVVRKRKLRSRGLREGAIIGGGSFRGSRRSAAFSQTGSHPGHLYDMHPAVGMQQGIPVGGGFWIPPPAPEPLATPPPPPLSPQELPASTHMHEHHPAFQSSDDAPEPPPVQVLGEHGEPHSPTALTSPLEGSRRGQ